MTVWLVAAFMACWLCRIVRSLAVHLVGYPRWSGQHFELLTTVRATRRGQVGEPEHAFLQEHGIDRRELPDDTACLRAVSGAELAYACLMLPRSAALAWIAATLARPGGTAALEVVHKLPAFGRRGRRLRRATVRLTAGRRPRRALRRGAVGRVIGVTNLWRG